MSTQEPQDREPQDAEERAEAPAAAAQVEDLTPREGLDEVRGGLGDGSVRGWDNHNEVMARTAAS